MYNIGDQVEAIDDDRRWSLGTIQAKIDGFTFVVTFPNWGKKHNVTVSGDEIRDPSGDMIQTVDPDAETQDLGERSLKRKYKIFVLCMLHATAVFLVLNYIYST